MHRGTHAGSWAPGCRRCAAKMSSTVAATVAASDHPENQVSNSLTRSIAPTGIAMAMSLWGGGGRGQEMLFSDRSGE